MYIFWNYELKIVVCLHRCHSANESKTITHSLGKDLSLAHLVYKERTHNMIAVKYH